MTRSTIIALAQVAERLENDGHYRALRYVERMSLAELEILADREIAAGGAVQLRLRVVA